MPDFSIITPVLNQASTIEATIISVSKQDVDVEHIIIDGGSTDGTVEIIKKHQNKLAHWVSQPDSGQPEAINKGLALAKGKFFNWLNADDRLTLSSLSHVQSLIAAENHVVIGKCQHLDTVGNVLDVGSAKVWPTAEATLGNYSMGQPSVFYRTDIVQDLAGLNENLHLCMDMDLWLRYMLKYGIKNIETTEEVLSEFLVHSYSKSESQAELMKAEKYGVYKALLSEDSGCVAVDEFLNQFQVPENVDYDISSLDKAELLSNFAWHLLVDAYQNRELDKAKALFETVKKGSRLTTKEQLEWKARLASAKFFQR